MICKFSFIKKSLGIFCLLADDGRLGILRKREINSSISGYPAVQSWCEINFLTLD